MDETKRNATTPLPHRAPASLSTEDTILKTEASPPRLRKPRLAWLGLPSNS